MSAGEMVRELHSAKNSLLAAVGFLAMLGLVMVYSSSWARTSDDGGTFYLFRQVTWLAIGATAGIFFYLADYRKWVKYRHFVLLGTLAILVLVLVPGVGAKINGARRWFRFGDVGLQASEFARVGMIIFLAGFLSSNKDRIVSFWRGFLPSIAFVGAGFVLIAIEPDIGMALLWGVVGLSLIFAAGARISHIFIMLVMGIPPFLLLVAVKFGYIMERIHAFLNPVAEASGKGYQALQSMIALGQGGLFGVGLGQSVQKMYFLPEPHTDFILAVLGEELGFIGVATVIGVYVIIAYEGLRITFWARDTAGHLMALGATLLISVQAAVNIGVVTGALPTKGMALPFLSYGGSNLVSCFALVGILTGVAHYTARELKALSPTRTFTVLPTECWPAPYDTQVELPKGTEA